VTKCSDVEIGEEKETDSLPDGESQRGALRQRKVSSRTQFNVEARLGLTIKHAVNGKVVHESGAAPRRVHGSRRRMGKVVGRARVGQRGR